MYIYIFKYIILLFSPFLTTGWKAEINENSLKHVGHNLIDMSGILTGFEDQADSIIPFAANCKSPILIIAGDDDKCGKSDEMVIITIFFITYTTKV
jgi:hypothetical protein